MARRKDQVTEIPYITLRRLTIVSTGQTIEKYSPFPSGLDVDYERLKNNRDIATLDEFQTIYSGRCLTCGE